MSNRWEDCLCIKDKEILDHYSKRSENLLFFLGKGFDPRMCVGLELVKLSNNCVTVFMLEYNEAPHSSSHQYADRVEANCDRLKCLSQVTPYELLPQTVLPVFLKTNFTKDLLLKYDRIVVDISAMPATISFNLVRYLVATINDKVKLDILVCENSRFDDAIAPTGLADTANYLTGFSSFTMELESEDDAVMVWIPLLGINCKEALMKIFPFVSPHEICPVLPFPSSNPRRADEILLDLGEAIFANFGADKKNLIYVSEVDVIQVYKKIYSVVEYYSRVLQLIKNNKSKFIFSNAASKLIGLGALLASIELSKNDIANSFVLVANDGYRYDINEYVPSQNSLSCVCLNDNIFDW